MKYKLSHMIRTLQELKTVNFSFKDFVCGTTSFVIDGGFCTHAQSLSY